MKLSIASVVLAGLTISAAAIAPQKQVLITFPPDTPESTLSQAKGSIEEAGGKILHEFELLKGFVVKASAQALESVHALSEDFKPIIEDDEPVTTQ